MLLKESFGYSKRLQCGLLYPRNCANRHLDVYSDADYVGDAKTGQSRTGKVNKFNGAISWMSKQQRSEVLSTPEAKYVTASEGSKEIMWLCRMLNKLLVVQNQPILLVDIANAIKLPKNPEFHKRSKHRNVRYHFVGQIYLDGSLDMKKNEMSISDS